MAMNLYDTAVLFIVLFGRCTSRRLYRISVLCSRSFKCMSSSHEFQVSYCYGGQ